MALLEPTALLISTDAALIEAVRGVISSIGNLNMELCPSKDQAGSALERAEVVLVLLHLVQGSEVEETARWLRLVADSRRPVATLVLSDQHRADEALALLRLGAAEYLSRPLDLNRLTYLIDVLTVRARYVRLPPQPAPAPVPVQVLGDRDPFLYIPSAAMGRIMEQIHRVAQRDTTVLLTGETGTGKTRLARLIHELSPRSPEPFLVVDCGTLSASLIESEMFGHVRGAFTGADRDRTGKFAEAGRGTLFLDEVDALSPALQTKLLRAVDERVFEPVGTNRSQPLLARLIVASNQALDQEVAAGRFRADLYYRLNVVAFALPPLRERRNLIAPLVHKLIADFADRDGCPVQGIAPAALRALEGYDWPGNIRELRNVLERAVALCPGPAIQLDDLPEVIRPTAAGPASGPMNGLPFLLAEHAAAVVCPTAASGRSSPASLSTTPAAQVAASTLTQTKEEAECQRIAEALKKHGNNRLRAAAELGISRMTLYNKLHKYGMMEST
jgi:DNA-binding NtrC family response regulator